jgi:hypothetical protein
MKETVSCSDLDLSFINKDEFARMPGCLLKNESAKRKVDLTMLRVLYGLGPTAGALLLLFLVLLERAPVKLVHVALKVKVEATGALVLVLLPVPGLVTNLVVTPSRVVVRQNLIRRCNVTKSVLRSLLVVRVLVGVRLFCFLPVC